MKAKTKKQELPTAEQLMKTQTKKEELPTVQQLIECAKLNVACRRDEPLIDIDSLPAASLDLWRKFQRVAAESREEEVVQEEQVKQALQGVRLPAQFPIGRDDFLWSLRPKLPWVRSQPELLDLYRKYRAANPSDMDKRQRMHLTQRGSRINSGDGPAKPLDADRWLDISISRDEEPTAFDRKRFDAEATAFLSWVNVYRTEKSKARARNAAETRWEHLRQAKQGLT